MLDVDELTDDGPRVDCGRAEEVEAGDQRETRVLLVRSNEARTLRDVQDDVLPELRKRDLLEGREGWRREEVESGFNAPCSYFSKPQRVNLL